MDPVLVPICVALAWVNFYVGYKIGKGDWFS